MSQGDLNVPVVGVVTGLTMAQDINNAMDALTTQNSGASAPTNAAGGAPVLGQLWLDTTSATAPILKQYTGAAWVVLGTIDVTNGIWTPPLAGGIATTIASASTTDLGSVPQHYVTVSGVVTITSLGTSAKVGTIHIVAFSGILTLTHNAASLILPTGANITTAAGDVAAFVMMTSGNWRCLWYQKANGAPLSTSAVGAAQLIASAQGMNAPLNLRINSTVGANALTVAIKGADGNDPSASNPVLFPFRDATIATGDPVILSLQAALSFTVAAGNTLGTPGTVNGVQIAFRLWVIAYYNGGTLAVGLFNASQVTMLANGLVTSAQIFPLAEAGVITTAASTNGGNSAGVHYANVSTIVSTPFRILGYLDWGAGLATAGTWASAPTNIKLFGPGDKKPGDIVQTATGISSTAAKTTSTVSAVPTTLPASSLSALAVAAPSFTPSAAPNLVRVKAGIKCGLVTVGVLTGFISVGAGAGNTIGCSATNTPATATSLLSIVVETTTIAPSGATTYSAYVIGDQQAGANCANGSTTQLVWTSSASGTPAQLSSILVEEIMG